MCEKNASCREVHVTGNSSTTYLVTPLQYPARTRKFNCVMMTENEGYFCIGDLVIMIRSDILISSADHLCRYRLNMKLRVVVMKFCL
jgi:hypothetical protein